MHSTGDYPDLLEGGPDPDLEQLIDDLDAVCVTAAPRPPAYLRATLAAALREWTPAARDLSRHRPLLRIRIGSRRRATLVGLLAAAVVAGSAVAGGAIEDRVFGSNPYASGTAAIVEQHLGRQVHLSQSSCGFTMTVDRVYADANRVVIGYTIAAPIGRNFWGFDASPALSDTHGNQLAAIGGAGLGQDAALEGYYNTFDAASLAGQGSLLHLRLVTPRIQVPEVLAGAPPPVSCETYTPNEQQGGQPPTRMVTVTGPFVFDLRVPVTPGVRAGEVRQIAQSGGTSLALDRVVVTRSETRVYLQQLPIDTLCTTLYAGGASIQGTAGPVAPDGMAALSFDAALYDTHGEWRLVQQDCPGTLDGKPLPVVHSWSFRFSSP